MKFNWLMKRIDFVADLFCALLLCVIWLGLMSLLGACSQDKNSVATGEASSTNGLIIEKATVVPVLDGKSTQTGIYIHNNTGQTISGIQYLSLASGESDPAPSEVANSHRLQINSSGCHSIAANSSCLLVFSTPSLSFGQSGSAIIIANYNGVTINQIINYSYYTSKDYTGVNFSDGSVSLFGSNDYATVYVFVGNSQIQPQVGFNLSDSSLAISNGLINGSVAISANQVIPLELKSNQNVTSNLVTVTPYTQFSFSQLAKSLQDASQQHQSLQITISPTQKANLVMSNVPLLNAVSNLSATITIKNNGNKTATLIHLTSADTSKTSISAVTCVSGGSLAAGASCTDTVTLKDLYNNGSSNINLAYNNSLGSATAVQTVSYYNTLAQPMIKMLPASSSLTESINSVKTVVFSVQNMANAPLTSLTSTVYTNLSQATVAKTTTTTPCGTTLNARTSCTVTARITSNANVDSGVFYVVMRGSFTNGTTTNYSFVSQPVATTIYDPSVATIASTTPTESATNVSISTNVILNFSKAMDPTTLNSSNIQLQKVSDSSSVPLTFQGVTNGNQTVTFTQTSGQLLGSTPYKIVINPSAIKDYNANPMGAATSQRVASFTTGDFAAPTISLVNPSNGSTNQSKTPNINITFSEPMALAGLTSSNIMFQTQAGGTVAGTSLVISNNNQTVTVNLNGIPLADLSSYQLVLNQANLTDVAGNPLGTNPAYVATLFTTGDFIAPTLSSVMPLNGATDVALESGISLSFSEAMNTATLTTSSVQLIRNSTSTAVSLNSPFFSNGNQTVSFQPVSNLASNESYSIVINPSLITDTHNNPMSAATSQTVSAFTTVFVPIYGQIMLAGYKGQMLLLNPATSAMSVYNPYYYSCNAIAYGQGKFVEVGNGGEIRYSTDDGVTWTTEAFVTPYDLRDITFSGFMQKWIAVGDGGSLLISSNGTSWTKISNAIVPLTTSLVSVAVNNGADYAVVVGNDASSGTKSGYTYYSTKSDTSLTSWNRSPTPVYASLVGVALGSLPSGSGFFEIGVENSSSNTGAIGSYVSSDANFGSFAWTWYPTTVNVPVYELYRSSNGPYGNVYATGEQLFGVYSYNLVYVQSVNSGVLTWTLVYPLGSMTYATNRYTGISFVNNYLVILGSNASIMYNNSGGLSNWSANTVGNGGGYDVTDVAYNATSGKYVICGAGANYGASSLATPAGTGWTTSLMNPSSITSATITVMGVSNTVNPSYVMIKDSNVPMYNTSGSPVSGTWQTATSTGGDPVTGWLYQTTAMAYGSSGYFVAVGVGTPGLPQIMKSTNSSGSAWVAESAPTTEWLYGVSYGNNQYVAVGRNGTILTSPTGETWTARTSPVASANWISITYANNQYVAVGGLSGSGYVMTSTNGITWTVRSTLASTTWNNITYGNNLYVAVGAGGKIITSPDGITWTAQSSGVTTILYNVNYAGGKYVASGELGVILTSSDGITWTQIPPLNGGGLLSSIPFN